ncbi:MAG TPA: tol-pal system-associated acyl-CoA thioesterase [Porticoccaceae bacterium]|nr:tol-pal system-associated acyl-CoA thioesterase [Porticoccaceae bacterium]HIG67974.1 tol-pal system-associated acyl-CoA thioesterase [Porticoccaceae bacterium]HIK80846.1 tol-pal system-associated acyl-CoA thioesterase [Porticoccaceae bacterium]
MTEFSVPMRVYIEDTDAGGIVYYANYLKFMERARTEYMRSLGYGKVALFDGLQLVVHDLQLKYHKPARLDDEIVVLAKLTGLTKVTFSMSQAVYLGDLLLVEGSVRVACINADNKRPAAIPKAMFQHLTSQMGV